MLSISVKLITTGELLGFSDSISTQTEALKREQELADTESGF